MASVVLPEDAARYAGRFMGMNSAPVADNVSMQRSASRGGAHDPEYYVFNNPDGGWVIIAADDRITPVLAYSESGTLDGPWIQEPEPVTPPNFGHSMLFQRFDGQWMMAVHSHAKDSRGRTVRIPHLFEVDLTGDKIVVKTE